MDKPPSIETHGIDSNQSHRAKSRSRRRVRRRVPPLLIVLFFASLVRLFLWGWFSGLPTRVIAENGNQEQAHSLTDLAFKSPLRIWDEKEYDVLARSLVDYAEFSYNIGEPASLRPPLYPLFLSIVYQVFGVGNYQAVRAFQAGLSLVLVVLLYDLGTQVYNRGIGLCGAGLYAFYPSLLVDNNLILTEVLFTFFLTAAVWALVRAFPRSSFAWLVGSGILFGLGALTRSVLWVFIPVLSAYVLAVWDGPWKSRVLASASIFLAAALTIAPWAIRNTMLEKTFLTIDSMGGRNLMMGNYEYTPMHGSWKTIEIKGEHSWDAVLGREEPSSLSATQGQKDKIAMRYALRYVLTHPLQTAQRDVVKFFDFWGLERELIAGASRGWFGRIPKVGVWGLAAVIIGFYVAGLFLGIFGALVSPPNDRRVFGLFLLVIGFVCAMHTLAFGHSRYHLPLMPLILIFAGAAVGRTMKIWTARGRRSFALAVLLSGVFMVVWACNLFFIDNQLVSDFAM